MKTEWQQSAEDAYPDTRGERRPYPQQWLQSQWTREGRGRGGGVYREGGRGDVLRGLGHGRGGERQNHNAGVHHAASATRKQKREKEKI